MFLSVKVKIQIIGRFLSNMMIPNISAFITWGLFTTLFLSSGWIPNQTLIQLMNPIINYLVPILIGYTGGRLIGGNRGAVVGSLATIGAIMSTSIPMLLGGMITGPIGGYIIKFFDKMIENKIQIGFEMLVNNFSAGIIGMILAILSFFFVGPFLELFFYALTLGVKMMTSYNILPLSAIIMEPAKVFFLNNAINHGVFSILGIQDVTTIHKSIFFLIESNPGPGAGILIAWLIFGHKSIRKSIGGAIAIQFLAGIHEIYFPYVLIIPRLIVALVLGGMTGIFTLIALDGGLVSPASPGSILAILVMTPKGSFFANITAIFLSFFVSFVISSILIKISKINNKKDFLGSLDPVKNANLVTQDIYKTFKNAFPNVMSSSKSHSSSHPIQKIIVACDAGMGSSAMGASVLRKKIKNSDIKNIYVSHSSISLLPSDVDLVITHKNLTEQAKIQVPNAKHVSLNNFLDNEFYNGLITFLKKYNLQFEECNEDILKNKDSFYQSKSGFKLSEKNIFLNQYSKNKENVIRFIGKELVKLGYVKFEYINYMLEREKLSPTWLGESVALPHGTLKAKDSILKTGIIFCQFPKGVRFGEDVNDIAHIVIGIAARNDEHIKIVSHIANALDDKNIIKKLSTTKSVKEVLYLLSDKFI